MFKKGLMIALLAISGQSTAELYVASDWIGDNVFTTGVEGPAVNDQGQLFAVNYGEQGTIGLVSNINKASLFIKLPNDSVGNGIRFDQQGNMYIADYVNHNVLFVKKGTNQVSVFAHSDKMNQPNDLAIMDNGTLFASDPNWGDSTGNLWKVTTDGTTKLLEQSMGTTNGVEVSPDNKKLYVNESIQRNVWVYDITEKGEVQNKKLLIKFDDFGLDGMRTDNQGNIYIARYGKGVVAIVSPQGDLIREVKLKGQHPTNVAFGGKDGKTVFVTMQKRGAIENFQSEFAGRRFN